MLPAGYLWADSDQNLAEPDPAPSTKPTFSPQPGWKWAFLGPKVTTGCFEALRDARTGLVVLIDARYRPNHCATVVTCDQ